MPVSFLGFEFSLRGFLDRINLFCLGLSASGYLTFLVAFGANILSLDPVVRAISFLFVPWWIAVFAGPAFFILAGIYYFLDHFTIGKFFGGASAFVAFIYVGALAAPMFAVATLIAGAVGGVQDAVNAISIPDDTIEEAIDLGPFDFLDDGLDDIVGLISDFIEGILYFILVVFFEKFLTGVRGQFIGSLTSIFFLILAMMTWPFRHYKKGEKKKIC